ncbi:unnamed protein product [Cladocopium goreaui]|uniref:Muskelin n=1 Tax=Cladocopium goreaui TaxID=2562237 RepID=A0A9P1FKU3_9DINO|nr:unnamed protein product [Cladocopium goreaui]
MSGHWTVEKNASGPVARYEHVAAWDAGPEMGHRLLWLHGGWDGQRAFRDLWKFDVRSRAWNLVSSGSAGPSERWAHVCAWDPKTRQLWVHGGWNSRSNLQDLWMFHAATERWLHLSLDVSPTARDPPAGHDHVAAFDDTGRSLLIHGGDAALNGPGCWDGFRVFRDLWTFDVDAQRWSLLDTGNSGPSARHDHVAVFDPTKRRLWIHGGGVISEEGFNDLWTFDVPRLQWSQVASGSGPSRCWGHVAAWDGTLAGLDQEGSHGEVWVHGGWSSGELWKFNVANNHWSLQGRSPTQMWEHATPILWLHGGRNLGGVSSAELWQFQSLEVESCSLGMPSPLCEQVLCLMLVALISSCVTDRMLWQRLRTAQLDGRWAPPKDGSKTKRSTAEVQVGFLGFVAHSAHQILGHVQAAQLRVLPADLQKVIDYVPWLFRWSQWWKW